jgi:hypothetical protein
MACYGVALPCAVAGIEGPAITAIGAVGAACATLSTPIVAGTSVVAASALVLKQTCDQIKGKLADSGYFKIPAKTTERWWMTLSLWQQAHCVRSYIEGEQILIQHLHMRPIFSGATHNSECIHKISEWMTEDRVKVQPVLP